VVYCAVACLYGVYGVGLGFFFFVSLPPLLNFSAPIIMFFSGSCFGSLSSFSALWLKSVVEGISRANYEQEVEDDLVRREPCDFFAVRLHSKNIVLIILSILTHLTAEVLHSAHFTVEKNGHANDSRTFTCIGVVPIASRIVEDLDGHSGSSSTSALLVTR